jgi:hypothetical protein
MSLNVYVYHGTPQKCVNHTCVKCYDLFPQILFYAMCNVVGYNVITCALSF